MTPIHKVYKGGIFKSCPRVPKLQMLLLRGWGRCFKVSLQTCAAEKNSAHADGGPSGGSRVRRPGSKDPHKRLRKFTLK